MKIIACLIPIVMVGLSFFYKRKAQGPISSLTGFRTSTSMKSQENWREAHLYASKLLFPAGVGSLIISLFVVLLRDLDDLTLLVLVFLQLFVYILIGIKVEKHLKKDN